uniref:Conotoxin Ama1309 n=1 Tax=Conus amadis TaxID=198732 RepID=T1309_CONAA|nr:RecName: Full=Conotoxin Ama1309 [Conus amadis]
CCTPFYFCCNN